MKLRNPRKFPNADVQKFFCEIDQLLTKWREEEFPRFMEQVFYSEGRPDYLSGTTPISDREKKIFDFGYRLGVWHVKRCFHQRAPITFGDNPPEPPVTPSSAD